MRLAFSIPVHEKNDVVADLVQNIFKYNPDSVVVLHISKLFADFDGKQFEQIPNLFINRKRYLTQLQNGLLLTIKSCCFIMLP